VTRVLAFLAVSAALVLPAASTAAVSHAKLSDCGKLVERPGSLVLACADANYELSQIGWNTWAGAFARGIAEVRANNCKPNCAAGRFHSYRAQVIADKLTRCGSAKIYLRLTILFTRTRPAGYKPADVHTWTCKQARTA
jgi:hypothetical protein